MSSEFSELQAVDFGLGAFIAAAFDELNAGTGPKEYREFLSRPTNRRIYRHDADSPSDFIKAVKSTKAVEKSSGNEATASVIELPVLYYYRKPGLTNGSDRQKALRGRYSYAESEGVLTNAYNLRFLPLVLDYQLCILSWDKPSLDKLQLAWYDYIIRNDKFTCQYQLGESDIFDVPASILDHQALLLSDQSVPPGQDPGRLYAVSTGLQVETNVLFGEGVEVPESVTIGGVLANYLDFDTGEEISG